MHSRCYKELERINMREFESGATRDTVEGKFDFEGFLSPAVLNRYAEYMNKHRTQADGNVRDSDNWQKGIPLDVYMKSGFRHFFSWWANHRHVDDVVKEDIEESLCALLFNVMGYLHEYLKDKAGEYNAVEIDGPESELYIPQIDDIVHLHFRINVEFPQIAPQLRTANYRGRVIEKIH
ncbi:hypothetical protein LCGC14_2716670, partial [marine sediment metagenome]